MANEKNSREGITSISIRGYKSLAKKCSFEIRPLTLLAGANSSGKSSAIQPLLLLKQTLEATYDPGAIRLDGPNVRFTSVEQLLSNILGAQRSDEFEIGIDIDEELRFEGTYQRADQGFEIEKNVYAVPFVDGPITLYSEMKQEAIIEIAKRVFLLRVFMRNKDKYAFEIIRERCFLEAGVMKAGHLRESIRLNSPFEANIRKLIHVPGLRGNPLRTYQTTAVGSEFPGTFDNYVASAITNWQKSKDERLQRLRLLLKTLGLTWKIVAKQINDTQVELRVGRLPQSTRGGSRDLVNIADVGFGVSQVLPVLVALLIAEPGQLVYIEQPELHLHPRAQTALANVLAEAANRGVRVVVETHSQLLLTAIQTLVAEGKLSSDKVKLHWFSRNDEGATEVSSADLDESGAFGDWPEDFAEVSLKTESAYLDAAMSKSLTS